MHKEFILGIGSQRAGSTFLARLLDQHPKIAIHPLKELHYFDTLFNIRKEQALKDFSKAQLTREINRICDAESHHFIDPRWKWYLRSNFTLLTTPIAEIDYSSLFQDHENLANRNIQFIGESTPEYMLLNDAQIAEVKAIVGDAYVLLMCRNPVKRIISSFRLMIEYNQHNKTEQELNQLFFSLLKDDNVWLKNQISYSNYKEVAEQYQKHFDKVILLAYDDVVQNPKLMLERLTSFLGLNFNTPKMSAFFERRINSLKVKYVPDPDIAQELDRLFQDSKGEINELMGRSLLH